VPFMLGVGIGVEEGEGDAFHILRAQFGHKCTHGGFVERHPHGALRVDALGDREAQGARRQRFRLVDCKVVLTAGKSRRTPPARMPPSTPLQELHKSLTAIPRSLCK
jgi:hypothetical protein